MSTLSASAKGYLEARNIPSAAVAYAAAVLAVLIVVALHWAMNPILGTSIPFMLFFPAVAFAALFGGLGPVVLALSCATVGSVMFFPTVA
jgi:hypothetical protein